MPLRVTLVSAKISCVIYLTLSSPVSTGVATLACVYTNANSILGKMQEIKVRFCSSDIIGVVETHASDMINDAEIALDGFNMHRLDKKGKSGGGLALYINSKWKSCATIL